MLTSSLRARGGGTLIFGAVGVLAVLFVAYTVWDRLSSSAADPPPRRAAADQHLRNRNSVLGERSNKLPKNKAIIGYCMQ